MRIGIAGPMTLELLRPHLPSATVLPHGYPFPMTALLVGELLSRGHEVIAYTTSTDITEPCYISNPPFTLCVVPSRPRGRARNLFRAEIAGLKSALHEYRCDILHAHWTYEFATAALLSGLPALITVHDSARAIFLQFRDAYRLIRWGINAYTVRRAPNLSVVSPYLLSTLSPEIQRKVVVIPNFIPDSLATRVRPMTGPGDYIVSVCNGFSRLKNLGNAGMGFLQARAHLSGMRYLLVGKDCEPAGPAQRFCEANGLANNVVFVGPASLDRVFDLVSGARLLLHPSYEESFGMAVLEAMALGTPVVAGNRSGNIPHLIQHERTGFLCDVSNPASISNALVTLLTNDHFRRSLGSAARKYAVENFSASIVIERYEQAYQQILAGKRLAPEASCIQPAA